MSGVKVASRFVEGRIEAQQSSGRTASLSAAERCGLPGTPSPVGRGVQGGPYAYAARIVSRVGSPPVSVGAAIVVTASQAAPATTLLWAVVQITLSVLVPFLHVVWLVQRGEITDIDVQLRKQRMGPLLVTVACTGLAWAGLWIGRAPAPMVWLAGGMWFQGLLILGITSRWKISVHAAAAAAATTWISLLVDTPLPVLLTVPLVSWSRVRLRRHTVAQTLAGTALGCITFFTCWRLGIGP